MLHVSFSVIFLLNSECLKSLEIAFSVNLKSLKFQFQFQFRSTSSLVSHEICSFQAPALVSQECTLLELGEVHPY